MELVSTSVTSVRVHRNGALVARRGTAPSTQVHVGGLPLLYASDSLRVRPETGTVLDLKEVARVDGVHQPVGVGTAVQELRAQQRAAKSRLQVLAALEAALQGLKPVEPLEVQGLDMAWVADPVAWLALANGVHQRMAALHQERLELERTLANLRKQLAAAEKVDPRGEAPAVTRGVTFVLAGVQGPVPFEVEYFVEAARWVPTYRLALDSGRAVFHMGAMVAQATGEDWTDTALTLSTADLRRDNTLPELMSWRMGRNQAVPRPAYRPLPTDLPRLFEGVDAFNAVAPPTPRPPPAQAVSMPPPAPKSLSPKRKAAAPRPPAPMMLRSPVNDLSEPSEMEEGLLLGGAASVHMDALAAAEPEAAPQAAALRSRRVASGAGRGGHLQEKREREEAPAPVELPPRLRFAFLRLRGPDEADRGTLMPVDPLADPGWFLQSHEATKGAHHFQQAVAALREAQRRLASVDLPAGASGLQRCHFHHAYAAPGKHSVPTDGTWYGVGLHQHASAATVEYRGVPRHQTDLFMFVRLDAPADMPLPAGAVQVHQDGRFKVSASLKGTAGGASLWLNLGAEPNVRVLSRVVHIRQEEKGLMSQQSRVEHHVRMELLNTTSAPVRVNLFDRLPVPSVEQEKDLTVEMVSSEPTVQRPPQGPDGKKLEGALQWQVELLPGVPLPVDYRYDIRMPAKMELVGGNRRE